MDVRSIEDVEPGRRAQRHRAGVVAREPTRDVRDHQGRSPRAGERVRGRGRRARRSAPPPDARVLLRHRGPRAHDDRRRGARDPPGRPRAHPAERGAQPAPGQRPRADPLLLLRGRRRRRGRRSTTPSTEPRLRVLVTRRLPDGGLDPLARPRARRPEARRRAVHARRAASRTRPRSTRSSALLTDRIDAERARRGRGGGRLRVVANVAVGYDNVDVAAAAAHGIVGVQHARRARRDDRRPRVPADPRPRRGSRPTPKPICAPARWHGLGHQRSTSARTCTTRRSASSASGASARRSRAARPGFGMRVIHHTRTPPASPGYVADLDALLARRRLRDRCTCPAAPRRTT